MEGKRGSLQDALRDELKTVRCAAAQQERAWYALTSGPRARARPRRPTTSTSRRQTVGSRSKRACERGRLGSSATQLRQLSLDEHV